MLLCPLFLRITKRIISLSNKYRNIFLIVVLLLAKKYTFLSLLNFRRRVFLFRRLLFFNPLSCHPTEFLYLWASIV